MASQRFTAAHQVHVRGNVEVDARTPEAKPARQEVGILRNVHEVFEHEHHRALDIVVRERRNRPAHGQAIGQRAVDIQVALFARRGLQFSREWHVGGDRTRLQDVQASPVGPVRKGPFNVHRATVVRLDPCDGGQQLGQFRAVEARAFRRRRRTLVDHGTGDLVHHEGIRSDLPRDQGFPQPTVRVDQHLVVIVGERVEGERDA